jgi:hypothetical protein
MDLPGARYLASVIPGGGRHRFRPESALLPLAAVAPDHCLRLWASLLLRAMVDRETLLRTMGQISMLAPGKSLDALAYGLHGLDTITGEDRERVRACLFRVARNDRSLVMRADVVGLHEAVVATARRFPGVRAMLANCADAVLAEPRSFHAMLALLMREAFSRTFRTGSTEWIARPEPAASTLPRPPSS